MEAYSWFNRRCHYRNSIVAFFNKPIFIAKEIAIRQWWMAIFMIIYLFFEISAMVFALNSTSHRYHFTVSNRFNTVLCSWMNHNISTRINRHHLIKTYIFRSIPVQKSGGVVNAWGRHNSLFLMFVRPYNSEKMDIMTKSSVFFRSIPVQWGKMNSDTTFSGAFPFTF